MRVAEIVSDFRKIQHFLASIQANPSVHEYHEHGFVVLRQCIAEARALLSQSFYSQAPDPDGDEEQEKMQLSQ